MKVSSWSAALYSNTGFFVLFIGFAFTWVPSVYAYIRLRQLGNRSNDDARVPPPTFVIAAIVLIVLLFCIFPLVYVCYLIKSQLNAGVEASINSKIPWYSVASRMRRWLNTPSRANDPSGLSAREAAYLFASMVAKVSLHAVVGFAVVGQSAALDTVMFKNNRTKIRDTPRSDNETLAAILGTSGGAFVGFFLLVQFIRFMTKPQEGSSKIQQERQYWHGLQWLHAIAAVVHITSAFGILGSAINDDSTLIRYSVRADFRSSQFFEPQQWDLQCYNATSGILESKYVSKCPNSLQSAFSNKHRGDGGFFNIAIAAFVFAAWSGLCHFSAWLWLISHKGSRQFSKAAIVLTRIRWTDYLVSAPTMLLTVNIIFAATNSAGIFAAPLLLLILEAMAGLAELSFLKLQLQTSTKVSMKMATFSTPLHHPLML